MSDAWHSVFLSGRSQRGSFLTDTRTLTTVREGQSVSGRLAARYSWPSPGAVPTLGWRDISSLSLPRLNCALESILNDKVFRAPVVKE